MGHKGTLGARLERLLEETEPSEPGFGAGVSVFQDGALCGEAWIGEAAKGREWKRTTPVLTWSVSKGIVSMIVARLTQEGLIEPDLPIATYWPAVGYASTGAITLKDIMTHRAGLAWLPDTEFTPSFADPSSWAEKERIEDVLAALEPIDGLVGKIGYHALTFGWLVESCVRRATGKGLSTHLQQILKEVEGVNMSFGTQCAEVLEELAVQGIPHVAQEKAADVDKAFADRENPLRKSLFVPEGMTFSDVLQVTNKATFLAAETPAMSLISDAGSLAKSYSLFAAAERIDQGALINASGLNNVLQSLVETKEDAVTGGARNMALGFVLNSMPSIHLSPGGRSFGHPGMGGSLAWGDPDSGIGFAYVTNASIPDTVTDKRASGLSNFVWEAMMRS